MSDDCKVISIPGHHDTRGNLNFLHGGSDIPFEIKRIFYMYDIPENTERGGHAHKEIWQGLIALQGSFEFIADTGNAQTSFHLNTPDQILAVPPGTWGSLKQFEDNAICLVLASGIYDADEYIRDYEAFLTFKGLK